MRGIRIGYPRGVRISGDFGSYAQTGQASNLLKGFNVAAAQGSYAQTGVAATLSTTAGGGSTTNITTFTLKSTSTSTAAPFSVGVGFKMGDLQIGQVATTLSDYQVVVKRQWSDGSVKHAIFSGRAPLTANVASSITINTGATPSGTNLVAADIQTAAPTAVVQCGSLGTVSLVSLLSAPFRTWISGPKMVECHYRADVGGGTLLSVWFHVRLFVGGRVWVRAIVENGYLDNGVGAIAANADRNYVPTVTIGGSTVYSNGGASLAHYKNTRWSVEGWIGGDPAVTATHEVAYLATTKLVPYYGYRSPTNQAFLTFITQAAPQAYAADYTPMAAGDTDGNMGSTGYGPFIGLLPLWNALYATSADPRALRHTLNNSSALNSRYIVWRDKTTNLIPRPSDFPTWNYAASSGGGGADTITTPASLGWDQPHHPGEGYLAYILTGDYWHFETLAMNASINYLIQSSNRGNGTSRLMRHTQVRGTAWMMRTVGCYAAIAPTGDTVAADYRSWLSTGGYDYFWGLGPGASGVVSQLGYVLTIGAPNGPLTIQPWMQYFWIAVNGFLWDIEPGFSSTTKHRDVRDFMYRAVVGIMGGQKGTGGDTFSYASASVYDGLVISPNNYAPGGTDLGVITSASGFSATWGDVWRNTATADSGGGGTSNYTAITTMGGSSGGAPNIPNGYWGNMLPALSYAVEHSAPGAQACYNRLRASTNYSAFSGSGFDNTPLWGITPRGDPTAVTVPYSLPASANTSVLIGTNTMVGVRPSSHSSGEILESNFAAYNGITFVPTYNDVGAAVNAITGGHSNRAMLGTMLFNFKTALWEYYAPGNGMVESPLPWPYPSAALPSLTYSELTVATSGQFPSPPHPAANRTFIDYGIRGSVGFIGRWSNASGGSETTASIHKMQLYDRTWYRGGNGLLAYQDIGSHYVYDPTTNRFYGLRAQQQNENKLAYWDPVTETTSVTTTFTPIGTGSDSWKRAFIHDSLRVLFYHHGPKMFGMNLSNIAGGFTDLSFSGSCPSSGNSWVFAANAWWIKPTNNGNTLVKFVPGSNPLGGTGVFTTVTIGGAGLPDFFPEGPGTEALHYSHLVAVPALGSDIVGWVFKGASTGSVALAKVS